MRSSRTLSEGVIQNTRFKKRKLLFAPRNKTIETFMKNLARESINNLMIAFFKDLQLSKFFKQHPQIMPGDFFLLAADCVHTHTYDHPHHVDENGENDCDCCLKRVYNRGSNKEKTRWLHNGKACHYLLLVFSSYLDFPRQFSKEVTGLSALLQINFYHNYSNIQLWRFFLMRLYLRGCSFDITLS